MTTPTIRVLSIKQPWASLIVRGVKRYEARSWVPNRRGTIAMHASSTPCAKSSWQELLENPEMEPLLRKAGLAEWSDVTELPRRAIVGIVNITDVAVGAELDDPNLAPADLALSSSLPWAILWQLTAPREITPISGIDGKLNLWTLPTDASKRLVAALGREPAAGKPHDDSNVSASAAAVHEEYRSAFDFLDETRAVPKALQEAFGRQRARPEAVIRSLLCETAGKPFATANQEDGKTLLRSGSPLASILSGGRAKASLPSMLTKLLEAYGEPEHDIMVLFETYTMMTEPETC